MTPFKNHPMPEPGATVVCVPSHEFLGLILTLSEVVRYAIEIDTLTQHGVAPSVEMTRPMHALSVALKDRLCSTPVAATRMPEQAP